MTVTPYRAHAEELAAGIHWAHRENFIRTYIRLREVDAIVSGRKASNKEYDHAGH